MEPCGTLPGRTGARSPAKTEKERNMNENSDPICRAVAALSLACAAAFFVEARPVQALALITAPVEDSDRVALSGNTHPLARAEFDRGLAPDNLRADRMLLVLRSSPSRRTRSPPTTATG